MFFLCNECVCVNASMVVKEVKVREEKELELTDKELLAKRSSRLRWR